MNSYPVIPVGADANAMRIVVNNVIDGKTNNRGTVTLTAGTTTTTITDQRITTESVILLMPTTANAAGAIGTTYISARGKKTATVTHANAVSTDRTFDYIVVG